MFDRSATIENAIKARFSTARAARLYGLADDEALVTLVAQALQTPGKHIRGQLVLAWHEASGNKQPAAALEAAVIIETLHAATLIIDDVQDKSVLRRGKPAFHTLHGEATAISVGLLMLAAAETAARKLHNGERLCAAINEHMHALYRGQAYDTHWQEQQRLTIPMQEYERMARYKTGALFGLCVRIADILNDRGTNPESLAAVTNIGLGYQFYDDALNLVPGALGKEYGEDVRERKITAVFIDALAHTSEKQFLLDFYERKSNDAERAITVLQESGAVERVRQRGAALWEHARTAKLEEKKVVEALLAYVEKHVQRQ